MPVTLLAFVLAIVLAALGIEVVVLGWSAVTQATNPDLKDKLLLVQIVMTFIAAFAAAILAGAFGRSNTRLQAQLTTAVNQATETLRNNLSKETAKSIAELNSELAKSVSASTELLKADLTKSGDEFRAELGQTVPKRHAAYHAMWAAASQYFRALQKFEGGDYPEAELKAANTACEAALGQSLLADAPDQTLFHAFWQEATFLAEKGEEKRAMPPGLVSMWKTEGRAFGQQYEQLREVFSKRLTA